MKHLVLSLLFVFAGPGRIAAQELSTVHYDVEKGLPSSELYDVMQDRDGFIWIASDRGVSRFDGYAFTNFTKEDGLADNTIFNIYEDHTGRLWFNSFNGKLSCYENGRFFPYAFNDTILKYIRPPYLLRTFELNRKGELVLGYYYGGILSVNSRGMPSALRLPGDTTSMFMAIAGTGWPGFAAGRFAYAANSPDSTPVFSYDLDGAKGRVEVLCRKEERQLVLALRRKNGNYCFGLMHTIVEIGKDGTQCRHEFDQELIRISEDKDTCLWISMRSGGVRRYGSAGLKYNAGSEVYFENETVSCVFQDNEGGFWFATLGNGLYYAPSFHTTVFFTKVEKGKPAVAAIIPDGNNGLFFGTKDGLLKHYNGETWETIENRSPGDAPERVLSSLFYDTLREQLYVGYSLGGGVEIIGRNGTFRNLTHQRTRCLAIDGNGNVYTGGTNEMGIADTAWRAVPNSSNTDAVFCDSHNMVWAGGMNGLSVMKEGRLSPVKKENLMLSARITGITEMPGHILALATVGNGVMIYDGRSVNVLAKEDGLAGNIVNMVTVDREGVLWVATNSGVSSIRDSAGIFVIRNIGKEQGLPTMEALCLVALDSELWIGTRLGLIRVKKDDTRKTGIAPPVYIYKVTAGDSVLQNGEQAVLSYMQNSLRFTFAGLLFRSQGNVNYRYRLEGLSDDWVETNSPQALFLSLPPGDYRFVVYALSESGVPGAEPATFSFTIRPPFWLTWWFISICTASVLATVLYFIFATIRNVKQENQLRSRLTEYQQQALANQMDPHFIFNSLNSIQSYLVTEDKRSALKYLSRFSRLMRLSLDNSRLRLVSLTAELELIRIYMELEAMRFGDRFLWTIDIPPGLETDRYEVPAMLIQPYVENALRHGLPEKPGNGRLELRIFEKQGRLCCEVEDDGVGREAAARGKKKSMHVSSGTSIARSRLQLLCRSLGCACYFEIVDKKNEKGEASGTLVKFDIPFRKKE